MVILGIDCSSKSASVGVMSDGRILSEVFINVGLTHSQTLMKITDECLNNSGLSIDDVDKIALTIGPGSFTGVRIGLAFVKGLCFTRDIPCLPVSTLEALCVNVNSFTGKIYSVLDARCSQVYFAEFESDGKTVKRLCDDCALTLEEVKNKVSSEKSDVIFVGDGAEICYEYLKNDHKNVFISSDNNRYVRGGAVCLSALEKGNTVNSSELVPNYLRLPQAQRNLKKDNK